MTVGIRELKNNLSHYVRQVERGKTISVTAHGRVVAELAPPARKRAAKKPARKLSRWEQMIADGRITLPVEEGDPFEGEDLTPILPPGSSREWWEWSREDK
jgi:prevent-host-death family protein